MIDQVALTVEDTGAGTYTLKGDGTGVSATTKIDSTPSSWQSWLLSLKETTTANLYYFGHGGPKQVGPDASPQTALGFKSSEIQLFMANRIEKGVPIFNVPYRFVFLDGCNTADGDLCIAFGIEKKKTPSSFYTDNNILPRAFVGWKTVKIYKNLNQFNADHANFIINFFSDWANQNMTVKEAIDANLPSGFNAPTIYGVEDLKWNP